MRDSLSAKLVRNEQPVAYQQLVSEANPYTKHLVITKERIAHVVADAIPALACSLPHDIVCALESAYQREQHENASSRAAFALDVLLKNAHVAADEARPLCQDTGSVWVCLEVGPNVCVQGDVFSLVNEEVARAYITHKLRCSLVRNALFDRTNTGNNTPAFCEVHACDAPGARVHIMLKGGGSDNASRIVMLPPSAGKQGIIDEILRCVHEKAANACPPLLVGIGVGATFDKVAHLAKMALMRPLDVPAHDAETQAFEQELLDAINATGIGAAALGGKTTALGVRVETAPCHIAALPLAINMGCCAMRRASYEL